MCQKLTPVWLTPGTYQLEIALHSATLPRGNNQIKKFGDFINDAGYSSPVRKTRGQDIMAACGQLKSDSVKIRKSISRLQV